MTRNVCINKKLDGGLETVDMEPKFDIFILDMEIIG